MKQTVLVTGSQGFIGTFLCSELLNHEYTVIGIDNFSKYGKVSRPHDYHPNFRLIVSDCAETPIDSLISRDIHIDYIIANAAMIGGIGYFHKYAFDLLAVNEAINTNTMKFAVNRAKSLKKLVMMSSSMVYENVTTYPTPEDIPLPVPTSTYGFQKLACEYFCKGAFQQYGLNYNVVRPFNCIGVGEDFGLSELTENNFNLALSHVVPDLIFKCLCIKKGDPIPILGNGSQLRHYTHGRDLAKGVRVVMEDAQHPTEAFNISSPKSYCVLQLLTLIYQKVHNTYDLPLIYYVPAYTHDVQFRSPDITKARRLLNFVADTPIETGINEVITFIKDKYGDRIRPENRRHN